MTRSRLFLLAGSLAGSALVALTVTAPATANVRTQDARPFVQAASPEAAGEYLMTVASCHDCHTTGWVDKKGNVPKEDQLTGNPVGYYGPWGTTYGKNLRQVADRHSEDEWVDIMRTADHGQGNLPMPWHDASKFSDQDLRALYKYAKSLGPKPVRLPRATKPGVKPTTGFYIDLTVKDSTGK
ncbi:MAG: cytochrome C [Gemmatimonadetes bacterium]|nr:cytochrome C [Gemmatimonadota bacterium]